MGTGAQQPSNVSDCHASRLTGIVVRIPAEQA